MGTPAPQGAAATAAPVAAPAAGMSDAQVLTRAKEWIARFQKGDIDRSQLSSDFSQTLDSSTVATIAGSLPQGNPLSVKLHTKSNSGSDTVYIYTVTWGQGTLSFSFGFDQAGKIDTAYFRAT